LRPKGVGFSIPDRSSTPPGPRSTVTQPPDT
jgi:hypothetical protein